MPWVGGDGHGEPRGDMLEGGKPGKENFSDYLFFFFNL